jgi:predicted metalloendopeptidase
VYHRLDRKGLKERLPLFDWDTYLSQLSSSATSNLQAINVVVPEFFTQLNFELNSIHLDDLKIYLKWHLMTAFVEALPKRFVDERFRFSSKAFTGQEKIEERWKRCVRSTNSKIGFALGRSFVEVAYGKSGKEKSQNMIHDVEDQFRRLLKSLKWMDQKTKVEAEAKLSKINNKVGYPKIWRSYDGLQVDRKSFLKNLMIAEDFGIQFELNKIGKPVDLNEWYMTPSTVNAYYDAQMNEMVFPAGILQYPFFNQNSPEWLNYGAMGVVMGHELTHGYDDQGRNYDSKGNLRNWWNQKVLNEFEKKTSCVVEEYSAFEVLPNLRLNGKLTLGENIADQGGMKLAYQAWIKKQGTQTLKSSREDMTPSQLYFLAFAQSWCQKEHEAYTRMRVTIDPHSPSRYRVNGVLSQFEPFSRVYNCSVGSKMAPAKPCEVW